MVIFQDQSLKFIVEYAIQLFNWTQTIFNYLWTLCVVFCVWMVPPYLVWSLSALFDPWDLNLLPTGVTT